MNGLPSQVSIHEPARSKRTLIAILTIGAILRIVLLWWFHAEPLYIADEQSYNEIAVSLVEHGTFAVKSGELTSLRPPLYPAMVATVYRLCGTENYQAVRMVQAVISLVNTLLVYAIARRLYDQKVAIWSAAIACFYPALLVTACFLLTETLFAFWVLLLVLATLTYLDTRSVRWLVVAGVALGLASLTRSVLWLFPPVLLGHLWIVCRDMPLRQRLATGLVPVACFVLVIAPWSIRNTRLQQTFTAVDVMGGRNLMMGNYEHTPLYRAWDAISMEGDKSWYAVLAAATPEFTQMSQGQRDKAAMRYGLQYMAAHPVLTLKRSIIKFFNFWQLDRAIVAGASRGWWGIHSKASVLLLAAIVMGSFVVTVITAVFGAMVRPPQNLRFHVFLVLLIGFVCALHTVVFGHSRYLLPLMPLLFIYSAAALSDLPGVWTSRGQTRFALSVAISLMLLGSWLSEVWISDLQHVRDLVGQAPPDRINDAQRPRRVERRNAEYADRTGERGPNPRNRRRACPQIGVIPRHPRHPRTILPEFASLTVHHKAGLLLRVTTKSGAHSQPLPLLRG